MNITRLDYVDKYSIIYESISFDDSNNKYNCHKIVHNKDFIESIDIIANDIETNLKTLLNGKITNKRFIYQITDETNKINHYFIIQHYWYNYIRTKLRIHDTQYDMICELNFKITHDSKLSEFSVAKKLLHKYSINQPIQTMYFFSYDKYEQRELITIKEIPIDWYRGKDRLNRLIWYVIMNFPLSFSNDKNFLYYILSKYSLVRRRFVKSGLTASVYTNKPNMKLYQYSYIFNIVHELCEIVCNKIKDYTEPSINDWIISMISILRKKLNENYYIWNANNILSTFEINETVIFAYNWLLVVICIIREINPLYLCMMDEYYENHIHEMISIGKSFTEKVKMDFSDLLLDITKEMIDGKFYDRFKIIE